MNDVKIATPISTLFADPQAAESIIAASDCLECRDRSIDSIYPRQELFHFELELPQQWSDGERAYVQSVVTKKPELKLLSFHAARCCTGVRLENKVFQPEGDMLSREALLKNAARNVSWLCSILAPNVRIAVENNNYYPTPAYTHVTDADFLSEVVEENSIHFLFDIAHAHIASHNRGIDFNAYVSGLPLARAVQLHICRYAFDVQNQAVDVHLLPEETDVAEVAAFIVRCSLVEYVTIEYYKDTQGLLSSIQKLRSIL